MRALALTRRPVPGNLSDVIRMVEIADPAPSTREGIARVLSSTIGIGLIVESDSALEFDGIIELLPVWPRMETMVTPLKTFQGRNEALRPRLERLKS